LIDLKFLLEDIVIELLYKSYVNYLTIRCGTSFIVIWKR